MAAISANTWSESLSWAEMTEVRCDAGTEYIVARPGEIHSHSQ